MDYLPLIIGFVTGGGISTIVAARYVKKSTKIDYADKAVKFMEDIQTKMQKQITGLETRISTLEKIACIKPKCSERVNPFKFEVENNEKV